MSHKFLQGLYLYSIFSAFAIISNLSSSTGFAYIKVAIIILGMRLFILDKYSICFRICRTSKADYPAREMITLLVIVDLSLWFKKNNNKK
jgi:hypothetical protein